MRLATQPHNWQQTAKQAKKPTTENELMALEWAKAEGYPTSPQNKSNVGWGVAYGLGVVLGGFPVLIVAAIHAQQRKQNKRDLNALVTRWVDAGKPMTTTN